MNDRTGYTACKWGPWDRRTRQKPLISMERHKCPQGKVCFNDWSHPESHEYESILCVDQPPLLVDVGLLKWHGTKKYTFPGHLKNVKQGDELNEHGMSMKLKSGKYFDYIFDGVEHKFTFIIATADGASYTEYTGIGDGNIPTNCKKKNVNKPGKLVTYHTYRPKPFDMIAYKMVSSEGISQKWHFTQFWQRDNGYSAKQMKLTGKLNNNGTHLVPTELTLKMFGRSSFWGLPEEEQFGDEGEDIPEWTLHRWYTYKEVDDTTLEKQYSLDKYCLTYDW